MDTSQIIVFVGVLIFGFVLGFLFFGTFLNKKKVASQFDEAQRQAEGVIDKARREADKIVKSALQEAKEDQKRRKRRIEEESKKRQAEIQKLENKIRQNEDNIEKKLAIVDKREMEIERLESKLKTEEGRYNQLITQAEQQIEKARSTLESVANMSADQAKKELIKSLESRAYNEARQTLLNIEKEMREEAQSKAQSILCHSIQRMAGDFVNDATVTVLNLPSDEMKGRIIGREGRNIRAIEQATGVDLIIDDTPEVVIISGFNPLRREVAKLTIEKLVADGRIHPARIQETVNKVKSDFDHIIKEYGEQASFDAGITDLHHEIIMALGRLHFKTNGKMTVLQNCLDASRICGYLAAEMGIDQKIAKRAGLLHKIGKGVEVEMDGHHAEVGADFCEKHSESDAIIDAIRHHHQLDSTDITPLTIILQVASQISESRPGIKDSALDNYVKRLNDMESLILDFEEIESAHIIQAGREIRAIVNSSTPDEGVMNISNRIASKLRKDAKFPGQIRVNVIKEYTTVSYAQ